MVLSSRTVWTGRSPYGERGLKFAVMVADHATVMSLSLRRAWIEINARWTPTRGERCRSPYGERGLKLRHLGNLTDALAVALLTESVD